MDRRAFLADGALFAAAGALNVETARADRLAPEGRGAPLKIFLCGDVMTGRGIDQILPHPGHPRLHEPYMNSALAYVELAERASGLIPRGVSYSYVWGDALAEFAAANPDFRIANLETAVTASDDFWRGKTVHYRMHPANAPVLGAAKIDCCALANNHVLDWGYAGLTETLRTLAGHCRVAGAGKDDQAASAPAVLARSGVRRVLVFAYGSPSSGVPREWAARPGKPGVDCLADFSAAAVERIRKQVTAVKRDGDFAIASIHWGSNWGYAVPSEQRDFAHRLIDEAAMDLVHGHSSHHPRPVEVYRGRAILYGCGDFINDYEGIAGHEEFRPELVLMYLVTCSDRTLERLTMTPFRIRRFRLQRASGDEARWLAATMDRESRGFGTRVRLNADGVLQADWG